MDLSSDPLMMYYELAEIQTLFISESWALSIYLISFPSMFQILIDLSLDPLIKYLESDEIQKPLK